MAAALSQMVMPAMGGYPTSSQCASQLPGATCPSFSTSCPGKGHQPPTSRSSFKNLCSAGLPRNTSLVFDIELEDGGVGSQWHEDSQWDSEEVVSEVERFIAPGTATEARLVSDVHSSLAHCQEGNDMPRLAQILTALGYRVQLRTALGGGDGADCLRNLRHTFVSVVLPGGPNHAGRRYVIDPQFKEQFIIAKATSRYCSIIAAVPTVLVAPEDHLVLLIQFLCTEMSTAFRQLGSVLPPWRQASSMLTKWQPRKSVDEAVEPAHATGGMLAAAGAAAARQRQQTLLEMGPGAITRAVGQQAQAAPAQPALVVMQQQQQQQQQQQPFRISSMIPSTVGFSPSLSSAASSLQGQPARVYMGFPTALPTAIAKAW